MISFSPTLKKAGKSIFTRFWVSPVQRLYTAGRSSWSSHNWGAAAEADTIREQQLTWSGGETSEAYLSVSTSHCANANRGESLTVLSLMDSYRHIDKHGDLLRCSSCLSSSVFKRLMKGWWNGLQYWYTNTQRCC